MNMRVMHYDTMQLYLQNFLPLIKDSSFTSTLFKELEKIEVYGESILNVSIREAYNHMEEWIEDQIYFLDSFGRVFNSNGKLGHIIGLCVFIGEYIGTYETLKELLNDILFTFNAISSTD